MERQAPTKIRRRDITRMVDYRRTANDSAVLQAVLDHGPVARSTVARLAGLSPAAVGRLTTDLVTAGLLRESAQASGPRGAGRPHIPVEIDNDQVAVCGVHIAVREATLTLLDLRGHVIACELIPHRSPEPLEVLAQLGARIPPFIAQHAAGRAVTGLGVATGGWVDRNDGVIVEHATLGWHNVPVCRQLSEATGLAVRADNHARALTKAEQLFGDVRARSSAVTLFVGNVIDAAFSTDGVIHHGPQSAAGLIAHMPLQGRDEPCVCGRRGCLQAVVSSRELGLRAQRAGITAGPEFTRLLDAACDGDRLALALLRERAKLLGAAVAMLVDVLNPELFVITEQSTRHLPECMAALRAEVGKRSRACADPDSLIVASSFGDDSLAVASGAVILDAIYANPLGYLPTVDKAC